MYTVFQHNFRTALFLLFPVLFFPGTELYSGTVTGTVIEAESGMPIESAAIYLSDNSAVWTQSGGEGKFILPNVPAGNRTVIVQMVGYHNAAYKIYLGDAESSIDFTCRLTIQYEPLPEIIVTPGRYEVFTQDPVTFYSFDREKVKSIAGLGEDFYRTLIRLPGVAANDFSARFNIRGGENHEVLALIDGQELYEPFHLKDYGGILSVIDMDAIGKVNLITGGFPAEYGDRVSGVLDMTSYVPEPGEHRTMLGLSFTSARALTEGTFANGKGNWLFSLRRGYLDIILDLVDFDTPANIIRYYDGFARLQYTLNKNHSFLFDFLQAGDFTEFIGDNTPSNTARSEFGNTYSWITWKYTPAPKLFFKSKLSFGRLSQEREGKKYFDFSTRTNPVLEDYTTDNRTFLFSGIKEDFIAELNDRHLLRGGLDFKYEDADYDYFLSQGAWMYKIDRFVTSFDTTNMKPAPHGSELALYMSDQWHIGGPFTADIGIRYDYYEYLNTGRLSPRISMMTKVNDRTVFRMSYGYYHQSPVINALPLHEPFKDNPRYGGFDPPIKARQYITGFEFLLPLEIEMRMEGYYKVLDDVWPRFESLNNNIEIFPETQDDRKVYFPSGGKSTGLELFLSRTFRDRFGFWFNYVMSRVTDTIGGRNIPRTYDQRHQVACDFNYHPNDKWNFHFAWMFHTGRPQTPVTFQIKYYDPVTARIEREYGTLYSARLPHYSRFDAKIIRKWTFSRYSLTGFLEIINLFGRTNVRRWEYRYNYFSEQHIDTYKRSEKWLPFLPSLGIALEF